MLSLVAHFLWLRNFHPGSCSKNYCDWEETVWVKCLRMYIGYYLLNCVTLFSVQCLTDSPCNMRVYRQTCVLFNSLKAHFANPANSQNSVCTGSCDCWCKLQRSRCASGLTEVASHLGLPEQNSQDYISCSSGQVPLCSRRPACLSKFLV